MEYKCKYCNSEDITVNKIEYEDETLYFIYQCNHCGIKAEDEYAIIAMEYMDTKRIEG